MVQSRHKDTYSEFEGNIPAYVKDVRVLTKHKVDELHQILQDNPQKIILVQVNNSTYNRGNLYTTQKYVDLIKVSRAREHILERGGNFDPNDQQPPKAFLTQHSDGSFCLVLGDGNHRVAHSLILGNSIDVQLVLPPNHQVGVWGFNIILRQVKGLISDGSR